MTVWTYVWQFSPQPRLIHFFYFKTMFAWILGLKTLKKSSTVLSGHAIRWPDFNDGGCHIREQSCCTAYVCWEDWTNFPPLGNIWPCWFLWQCIKITSTVKSVQVSSADKWWHVVITVYRKVVSQLMFGGDCIGWLAWDWGQIEMGLTGFMLSGNFQYVTSYEQNITEYDTGDKSVRCTGCYFVWLVLKNKTERVVCVCVHAHTHVRACVCVLDGKGAWWLLAELW